MVMAEFFTHDRLQELWHQIHHLHLTFLDTEDSPQKIDQRNKLEVCIREYLCIAPHNRKFYCPETAEVLHRSASNKKDFSGYRAALAWNAVSMYAGNLLSQPWRKEYRQIKTYSGFYKHEIEANLVGAEAMFEAMGYKKSSDGVLVLDGPVCPDRLTNVSQDSIVAFVECQILKSIWEEVSANFKISWLDVLEFRESHLCSPEQCARMLKYRYYEKRYQQEQYQQNNTARLYHQQQQQEVVMPQDLYGSMYRYHMHSYPPPPVQVPVQVPVPVQIQQQPQHTCPSGHIYSPPQASLPPSGCPPSCLYSHPYYPHHYPYTHAQSYPPPISTPRYQHQQHQHQLQQHQHQLQPHVSPVAPAPVNAPAPVGCHSLKPCNGYCYPAVTSAAGMAGGVYVCPTGQLIELEGAQNGNGHGNGHGNGQCYDVPDAIKRQQALESHKQLAKSTNLDSLTLSKSKEDGAGTFESWDYVYRNLESQGYYKDLSDRPDVLQTMDKKKHVTNNKKNKNSVELEDQLGNLNMKKDERLPTIAQSTSYDNLSSQKITNGTLDGKKRRQDIDKKQKKSNNVVNWNCNYCTFLNTSSVEICDMCGKSKRSVDQVLAVGGPQCPRCTLVNQKDANVCQACYASLLNSPTYI